MDPSQLRRLVEIIVEELAHAVPAGASGPCRCHGVLYDCCPDRVRGVLDAGATRLGLHASGGPAGQVASLIDHTLLKADATRAEIEKLCREAAEFGFATVCVNPTWVALRARLLAGSRSGVCSVVGFPLGRDDAGREALRDPSRDFRRRARSRHGDQHRRAQVRRSAPGRARHRGRRRRPAATPA